MAAGPFEATVTEVRSFDDGIRLKLTNGLEGRTQAGNNLMLHAVAAGAQGGNRTVWIQYDEFKPDVLGGFFTNVRMAFDTNTF